MAGHRDQQIETQERRAYILELRKSGATYRQIAAATIRHFGELELQRLGDRWREVYPGVRRDEAADVAGRNALPKGFDERYVWTDVDRELKRLRRDNQKLADGITELESQRLDQMLLALWPQVREGDTKAVNAALRIMERRARLLGLDAPTRGEHDIQFTGNVELHWPEDT